MRPSKYIVAMAVIAGLSATPSTAQAGGCHSFTCVNRQVSGLQQQVRLERVALRDQASAMRGLFNCLAEVPVTQYGDPNQTFGYQFNSGDGSPIFGTSALDITQQVGGSVGAWFLIDRCNKKATRSTARAAGSVGNALSGIARVFTLPGVNIR